MSIDNIVTIINNIIFKNGEISYDNNNYLTSLNESYYYNIPDISDKTPSRNFVMWAESDINYLHGQKGNKYIVNKKNSNYHGLSEFCSLARRAYADLWNSNELDINYALKAYKKSPNNFKPKILPTSNFRVTKKNDKYINIAGVSNDFYTIDIFDDIVTYADFTSKPIFSVSVTLQETPRPINLNIQEWIDYLNNSLLGIKKNIKVNGETLLVSDILSFDWSFFPYGINLLNGTIKYIKSAIIKTKNSSNYYIRITARWSLLQLMGKCMTGRINLTPPLEGSGPCCSIDSPCDEEYLYGVYDNYIQSIYPYYATSNQSKPIGILCPRRNAELIIEPNNSYIGLYVGFDNENLDSFSVNFSSTEIWTYLNADYADSHPFHMHMTSGFVYQTLNSINNTPNTPGSNKNVGFTKTYSRDIFQIGPQQSISFAVKWPYYASNDSTNSPYLPNIGGIVHCHYLNHNDLNGMMISYSIKPMSNFLSNSGFLAGTLIKTDQGTVPIDTIISNFHTIDNKKIIEIIKTISIDDFLVCFEKNCLSKGIPSKKIILNSKQKIIYDDKIIEADSFIEKFDNIYKIKYNGEILYNLLMTKLDKIKINNLICETLNPNNHLTKIHKSFEKLNLNSLDTEKIIQDYNSVIIKKLSPNLDKSLK